MLDVSEENTQNKFTMKLLSRCFTNTSKKYKNKCPGWQLSICTFTTSQPLPQWKLKLKSVHLAVPRILQQDCSISLMFWSEEINPCHQRDICFFCKKKKKYFFFLSFHFYVSFFVLNNSNYDFTREREFHIFHVMKNHLYLRHQR